MLYGMRYEDTKETDEERWQRKEDQAYVDEAKDYLAQAEVIWEDLQGLIEDAFDGIIDSELEEKFKEAFDEFLTNIQDELGRRESNYDSKGYGYGD